MEVCLGTMKEFPYWLYQEPAHPNSIIIAEATALEKGLSLAISLGSQKICIRSDSMLLVNWVNRPSSIPWSVAPILSKIRSALLSFVSWKCSHCYREANSVADWLASAQSDFGERIYTPSELPPQVVNMIENDRMGGGKPRGA